MSETIVSSHEELISALKNFNGLKVVKLLPGDYGELRIDADKDGFGAFPEVVTIKSDNKASFSKIDLSSAENLHFDGILFDYVYQSGYPDHVNLVTLDRCKNVSIFKNLRV